MMYECTVGTYIRQRHEDGGGDGDAEGGVVPPPDALVQPLAVVVKHVNTLM